MNAAGLRDRAPRTSRSPSNRRSVPIRVVVGTRLPDHASIGVLAHSRTRRIALWMRGQPSARKPRDADPAMTVMTGNTPGFRFRICTGDAYWSHRRRRHPASLPVRFSLVGRHSRLRLLRTPCGLTPTWRTTTASGMKPVCIIAWSATIQASAVIDRCSATATRRKSTGDAWSYDAAPRTTSGQGRSSILLLAEDQERSTRPLAQAIRPRRPLHRRVRQPGIGTRAVIGLARCLAGGPEELQHPSATVTVPLHGAVGCAEPR